MAGRKTTFDTEKAINLLKMGLKNKEIAAELNIKESTLKMFFMRHASEELAGRKTERKSNRTKRNKDDFIIESSNKFNAKDLQELREESRNGINSNESISDYSFIKWNRQSYVTDKETGILRFDKNRGGVTKDIPRRYDPIV